MANLVERLKLKNSRKYPIPRQIAMYLCRELTNQSLPGIARSFNGIHHTTVLSAVKKIEALMQSNRDVERDIGRLTDFLLKTEK